MEDLHRAGGRHAKQQFQIGYAGLSPDVSDSESESPEQPDNYAALRQVLDNAFKQAATGKGAIRHGQDKPFEEQPMQQISELLHGHSGLLFQAIKKTQESTRLAREPAIQELLGAINYLAGAIIYLEKTRE